jgi:hypothetical protein
LIIPLLVLLELRLVGRVLALGRGVSLVGRVNGRLRVVWVGIEIRGVILAALNDIPTPCRILYVVAVVI